ncbi:metaxin-2 [Condylostylus longicornis]|uniref:metaxin-2 n=1 Tax=Condylostylus longicornis TaxID=2530218 RepID=UPI00244E29C8|nr:metaxin-2 [Condylostylus longicornis]
MAQVLKQLAQEEAIAREPWPDDSLLYQPFDAEQILLAEQASCLAVKAYLKMCKLPFNVRSSANAEFMSPGGRMTKLPFIKAGEFVIAEFEPIVSFIETKGTKLTNHLDEDEKDDLRAYLSLVENIFTNAELYLTFMDDENYHQVTSMRYGSVYPWPLKAYQNGIKRRTVIKQLNVYQWKDMTLKEVVDKVEKCCEALTERLGDRKYFNGDLPTELDAITFGHIFTILTTKLPNNILAETVNRFDKLVNFCANIDKEFFRISS